MQKSYDATHRVLLCVGGGPATSSEEGRPWESRRTTSGGEGGGEAGEAAEHSWTWGRVREEAGLYFRVLTLLGILSLNVVMASQAALGQSFGLLVPNVQCFLLSSLLGHPGLLNSSSASHRPLTASRGIGLAITRILLDDFKVQVVAISRSRSPALFELQLAHPQLEVVECDVCVDIIFAMIFLIGFIQLRCSSIHSSSSRSWAEAPLYRRNHPERRNPRAYRKNRKQRSSGRVEASLWCQLLLPYHCSPNHPSRSAQKPVRRTRRIHQLWCCYQRHRCMGPVQCKQSCDELFVPVRLRLPCPSAIRPLLTCHSRTLATEEPDVVAVALRPGMVDTNVRPHHLTQTISYTHLLGHSSDASRHQNPRTCIHDAFGYESLHWRARQW